MNVREELDLVRRELQSGSLPAAERRVRAVLAGQPNQPEALNLLGRIAASAAQNPTAVQLFQQALAQQPNFPEAWMNLGVSLAAMGQTREAASAFARTAQLQPNDAHAWYNLGLSQYELGDDLAAIAAYRKAESLQQDSPLILNNLGNALYRSGQLDEALGCLKRVVQLAPSQADGHVNLGNVLKAQGKVSEASAAYKRAITLRPNFAASHYCLANVLVDLFELDQAIAGYRRTIELSPLHADAWNNLGHALASVGEIEPATIAVSRSLAIRPENSAAHSNLIYLLHFDPAVDSSRLMEEQKKWDDCFGKPLAKTFPLPDNTRDPDRRLKIGYVSPDFRAHVIGWNLLPILENHNHQEFEIYCYSSVSVPDEMTEKLRRRADVWREVRGLDDAALAKQIREDGINILIDLALHSQGTRLPTFARKPAPIQISYLGFGGGAGVSAIQYRFTDSFLDDASTEGEHVEKPLYLPSYWCYRPGAETPEPSVPDSSSITFACLNNFAKVSLPAQELWAKILAKVENSKLLLHIPRGMDAEKIRARFSGWGFDPGRLQFLPRLALAEYFAAYRNIDVALDPFPYAGGITTCDALWMGAPVVTLAGKTSAGRAGKSILGVIGHGEWVAQSADEYLEIAVYLAMNSEKRSELRTALRNQMLASPLMNAKATAAAMESRFREIWKDWRQGGS